VTRRLPSDIGRLAGGFALASGLAYLAYWPLGFGDASITAWNLLIIPTALYLGAGVASRGPIVSAAFTAAGVTASLLWAFSYRLPAVEPWWIGLAAVWWLGLGWLLAPERRALGRFTLLLGVAAAVDFVLTALNAPMPIYALGGFKIPLTMVWSFWVGLGLVRDPRLGVQELQDAGLIRWSGATALVGGLLWIVFAAGWTLSHGSTESPRNATFLGLGALEFTRLLAVPAGCWVVSLVSSPVDADRGPAARIGFATALLGVLMIGLGALLQTSIVDPERDFGHPAVQGGWLLFIAGLFPVLSSGMLLLGISSPRAGPLRRAILLIGIVAPLPVVAFFLSGVSTGAPGWDVALATMHSAPGLGWFALGYVLSSGRLAQRSRTREPTALLR
jgi:hypothetical protein